jgi:hypothetical protein
MLVASQAAALLFASRAFAEPGLRTAPEPVGAPVTAFPPFATPEQPMTEAEMWMGVGRAMERITRAFAWAEMAIPDLRLQTPARVGDGVDALVLSWPVHLVGVATREHRTGAGATLFVEPAFPTNHWAARGLGGVRLWGAESRTGLAAVLEGGGIVATDGYGAFAGGGPAVGDVSGILALVARRSFVLGRPDRWDFTLELTMPLYTLGALLSAE